MKDNFKLREKMTLTHNHLLFNDPRVFESIIQPQILYKIEMKDSFIKTGDVEKFYTSLVAETTSNDCSEEYITHPNVIPKNIVIFMPTLHDLAHRNFNSEFLTYHTEVASNYDETIEYINCDFESVYNKSVDTLYIPLTVLIPFNIDMNIKSYIKKSYFRDNISVFALMSDIFRDTRYITNGNEICNTEAHEFLKQFIMIFSNIDEAIDKCAYMTDSRCDLYRDQSINKHLKFNSIRDVVDNIGDTITPKGIQIGKVGDTKETILKNIASHSPFINHVSNAIMASHKFINKYEHIGDIKDKHMWEVLNFTDENNDLDKYFISIHKAYYGENVNVTVNNILESLHSEYVEYGLKDKIVDFFIDHKVEITFLKYGDSREYVTDVCDDMFILVKFASFIKDSFKEFVIKYREHITKIEKFMEELNCLDNVKGKIIHMQSNLNRIEAFIVNSEPEDLFTSLRELFLSGVNPKSISMIHGSIMGIFSIPDYVVENLEDITWYDLRLGSYPVGEQRYIGVLLSNFFTNKLNFSVEEREYDDIDKLLENILK